jgi:thioredoxin reductase (NADPH)
MVKKKIYNSVIIGSGPAGYTAAIYLSRAQLFPLIISGIDPGGQLMWTTEVENYPGFSNGILGPVLMDQMRDQAVRFGAKIKGEVVKAVDFSKFPFKVSVYASGENDAYLAKTVVITTGAKARMLGVGEERLLGKGVSTCAVCDAAFYKGKDVFVIGGGDAAMEDVLAVAKFAKKVTLIHRRNRLRASKIMQDRILNEYKEIVKVIWHSQVVAVTGDKRLESIKVEDLEKGEVKELHADGLFLAIGHVPVTDIFQGQIDLDEKGYVVTRLGLGKKSVKHALAHVDEKGIVKFPTMTSVEGVFAAGDVVDFSYRQAVTAAGFGCMAGLDVEHFITGTKQSW